MSYWFNKKMLNIPSPEVMQDGGILKCKFCHVYM
jgi:hypothetical protein